MSDAAEPAAAPVRVDRSGLAATRVAIGAASGTGAAAVTVWSGASWSVAALCASDVAALVSSSGCGSASAEPTRRRTCCATRAFTTVRAAAP
jgi:hypothetical protein